MNTPSSNGSSCLFRIEPGTKRALWQVTNQCNYNCRYCIFSSSGSVRQHQELGPKAALTLIHQLKQAGFSQLKLTGGEPFLRKDIFEIIDQAALAGFTVDVSTNASLIQMKDACLLKDRVAMVHVGIDGPDPETQETVRGAGSFDATLRGIRHLVDAGVYVRLGCALYRGNDQKLAEMVVFAMNLGVKEIIFSRMEPAGRMANEPSLASLRGDAGFQAELECLRERYGNCIRISGSFHGMMQPERPVRCPGGESFIYVNPKGQTAPCTWAVELSASYLSVQTLGEESLQTLLLSHPFASFRQIKFRGSRTGCPCLSPPEDRK